MENNSSGDVTRRDFLKLAGIGGGGLVLGAIAGSQAFPKKVEASGLPEKWDEETDVVVVGSGYAGLTAAVVAADEGAKVVILEKEEIYGGNSAIASGAYNASDPKRQEKQGIKDSPELHAEQTLKGGDFRGDPEKVKFMCEEAPKGLEWLESIGVEFEDEVVTIIGAIWPRSHRVANGGRGKDIVDTLKKQCDKRNIPLKLGHKVTKIYRDNKTGIVAGVEVENNGNKINLKAKKAVILASGGFSSNVEMRSAHDPRLTKDIPSTNIPGATGEIIIYAQDIGADVVGMDYIQCLLACNYYTKKYGDIVTLGIDSSVFINTKGERFVAEDQRRDVIMEATIKQPEKLCIWVSDDAADKRYGPERTQQILDKELAFKADTLEDLAKILKEKFGVPEAAFLDTVKKYNEFCKAGKDADFGKNPQNLKPLVKAPFYASPAQVGVHHTMGGLRVKGTTCQVLDRNGKVIPHLYAAGEVTGGTHGTNRLGGNATTDCIVFGRVAGQNAAKEQPIE